MERLYLRNRELWEQRPRLNLSGKFPDEEVRQWFEDVYHPAMDAYCRDNP